MGFSFMENPFFRTHKDDDDDDNNNNNVNEDVNEDDDNNNNDGNAKSQQQKQHSKDDTQQNSIYETNDNNDNDDSDSDTSDTYSFLDIYSSRTMDNKTTKEQQPQPQKIGRPSVTSKLHPSYNRQRLDDYNIPFEQNATCTISNNNNNSRNSRKSLGSASQNDNNSRLDDGIIPLDLDTDTKEEEDDKEEDVHVHENNKNNNNKNDWEDGILIQTDDDTNIDILDSITNDDNVANNKDDYSADPKIEDIRKKKKKETIITKSIESN